MRKSIRARKWPEDRRGFTLLELLLGITIFLIISAAALSLVSAQMPLFNRQQNMATLNIAVRNAVSQLQLDLANAGNGILLGTMQYAPVAITINNSMPSSPCNTASTYTYGASCFDSLNIIQADSTLPAAHPDDGTFNPPANGCSTDYINTHTTGSSGLTAGTLYLLSSVGTTQANAISLGGTSASPTFHTGDEVLVIKADGTQMTVVKLTGSSAVVNVGAKYGVKLTYTATNSDGTNGVSNDPLLITTTSSNTTGSTPPGPISSGNYCGSSDWVVRLTSVTYTVDTSTSSDPKLVRLISGAGEQTVAEQVIGFKVGATTWNSGLSTADDNSAYNYFASNLTTAGTNPGYNNEFWLIRSVQVSLIGRTTPNPDPTFTYRNGFDSGPYFINSVSVVENPRNLSMNNH